jgi:hypothetical protein
LNLLNGNSDQVLKSGDNIAAGDCPTAYPCACTYMVTAIKAFAPLDLTTTVHWKGTPTRLLDSE